MGNKQAKKIYDLPHLRDWSVSFDQVREKVQLSGYITYYKQKTNRYVDRVDIAHIRKIWRTKKCYVVQLENADTYRLEFKYGLASLYDRLDGYNIIMYKNIFDNYCQYVVIEGSFDFDPISIASDDEINKILDKKLAFPINQLSTTLVSIS